jgi:hypothetical protein
VRACPRSTSAAVAFCAPSSGNVLRNPTAISSPKRTAVQSPHPLCRYVEGMDPEESDALLAHLYAQAENPEYQCFFQYPPSALLAPAGEAAICDTIRESRITTAPHRVARRWNYVAWCGAGMNLDPWPSGIIGCVTSAGVFPVLLVPPPSVRCLTHACACAAGGEMPYTTTSQSCMHRALSNSYPFVRKMRRVTVQGTGALTHTLSQQSHMSTRDN